MNSSPVKRDYVSKHNFPITSRENIDRFSRDQVLAWATHIIKSLDGFVCHFEVEREPTPVKIADAIQRLDTASDWFLVSELPIPSMAYKIITVELDYLGGILEEDPNADLPRLIDTAVESSRPK